MVRWLRKTANSGSSTASFRSAINALFPAFRVKFVVFIYSGVVNLLTSSLISRCLWSSVGMVLVDQLDDRGSGEMHSIVFDCVGRQFAFDFLDVRFAFLRALVN